MAVTFAALFQRRFFKKGGGYECFRPINLKKGKDRESMASEKE
jgi:hypothetical protein